MKKFICGFLAGAILFGGIGAIAVSYVANPVDFKVLVNGKEFVSDPPALEVEGRTYLPLRAMGEALGVPVNWNEELRQAEVGNTAPVAQTGEYSRQNPAPLNTVQKISVKDYSSDYSLAVRVIESHRGQAATAQLQALTSQYSSVPSASEGYELILAKIAVSLLDIKDDKSLDISIWDFDCFSGNNEKYELVIGYSIEGRLESEIYAGGNADGYMVFQVKKDDANPKIVYGQKYDGSGGLWFALQ